MRSLFSRLWDEESTTSHKSTPEAAIAWELSLRDRLTALKNLRPGTRIKWPDNDLSRQILRDLLDLPDGDDPVQRLTAERGIYLVWMALMRIIEIAETMYDTQDRTVHDILTTEQELLMKQTLQGKYGTLHGIPFKSGKGWDAHQRCQETIDGGLEHRALVDTLSWIRRKVAMPTESSPSRSLMEPSTDTLLADLLRLPETVDPVHWLFCERLSLCARIALEHLMQMICPMDSVDYSANNCPILCSIRPKTCTRSNGRLHVKVLQIDILKSGFAIHLNFRFRLPKGWSDLKHPGIIRQWEGFRSVRDTAGHHYVVQIASMHTSNQMWWWTGDQTLVCWPSLQDADKLILEAVPAYLALYRPPSEGGALIPMPGPVLGEVSCTADIAQVVNKQPS